MSATLEEITKSAISLPSNQRIALAGFLLELDERSESGDVAEAWEKEIQQRIRAIDSKATESIRFSIVMREASAEIVRATNEESARFG